MAYTAIPDRGDNRLMHRPQVPAHETRRAVEFRRARQHTVLVRALKVLLPAAAAGILSLYILPSFLKKSIDHGRGTASVRSVTIAAGSLKMIEPHVKGVNERGEAYDFAADSATQAAKDADTMYLETVRGKMTGLDGKVSTLTAPDGVHNNKAEEMTFNNGAVVTRDGGMSATFKTATAFMKQQTVISKTPVTVHLLESTIQAETMALHWGEQRAIFEGRVRTHIERAAQPGTGSANAKKPIDIESDRLEVDDKKHIAIFTGSVSATQGDDNLKAPRLDVTYENTSQTGPADKTAEASKLVKPVKAPAAAPADDPLSSGQIKFIHALGGTVVMTSEKDQQRATGEEAIYDVTAQKIIITGKKVVLTQKGHIFEDSKLLIHVDTGQAVLCSDDCSNDAPPKANAATPKPRGRAVLQPEGGKGGLSVNPSGEANKKEKATVPPKPAVQSLGWQTQSR
jgi:LPS export ABC transporter protein LptC